CSFEARLQRLHGSLGEHQALAAENVVDVDALHRQHVDVGDVASRQGEGRLNFAPIDDERVGEREPAEALFEALGLAVARYRPVEHYDLARLGLGGERMLQSQRAHLLGQFDGVAPWFGAEHLAAAAPLGHRLVAMTGIARALLPVHLLARDGDFRPVLHVMRAGHALQELIAHHAVDQILARLQSEDGIAEFHLAGALGIERLDGRFHGFCSAGSAAPGGVPAWAPSALRNDPGFGASLGSPRLTASRTNTQPPWVPGTAPRTSTSPRSLSVSTTSRLSVVTRTLPIWPAIFLPLKTLPGSWR